MGVLRVLIKNLLITMSGGTTTVINATLVGIVRRAQKSSHIDKIYAGYPGIIGVLNHHLLDLTELSEDTLKKLTYTPASGFIGTTRVKILDDRELNRLSLIFKEKKIGYFLNIGGNGTIKQTMAIKKFFKNAILVGSLPKTVDNDLGDDEFKKVFYTPGYPSCANYWIHKVHMLNQENLGAFSHDQVLIAQTFGRETGFLVAAARLADRDRRLPLLLLLPEDQQPLNVVLKKIESTILLHKRAIIIMSEGYKIDDIGEIYDYSGQVMYGSSKSTGAQLLVNKCIEKNIQARHFIPGIDQRCDIAFTLQSDIIESINVGNHAVEQLENGINGFLSSIGYDESKNIIVNKTILFEDIKNFSRRLPDEWVDKGNFDVTDLFIEYAEKLIIGERAVNIDKPYLSFYGL